MPGMVLEKAQRSKFMFAMLRIGRGDTVERDGIMEGNSLERGLASAITFGDNPLFRGSGPDGLRALMVD
jgi:hypothetical protein